MDKLIQLIVDKTGISPENARTAITTVLDSLKDKLPAGVGEKVTALIQDKDGDGDVDVQDIIGNVKDTLGGLFGKK